jgi:hypothetical protein
VWHLNQDGSVDLHFLVGADDRVQEHVVGGELWKALEPAARVLRHGDHTAAEQPVAEHRKALIDGVIRAHRPAAVV